MNKIVGKVTVKETSSGVPDVLVVTDPPRKRRSTTHLQPTNA